DFATTLLVVLVLPDVLAVAQVGDGAVVARWADGSFQAVTRPSSREYVNETTFLTSATYLDQAQVTVQCGALSGLALFTDGLQRLALKLPQAEPHAAFFAPLLDRVAEASSRERAEHKLEEFLQSPRLSERTEDDLTLVLAVRAAAKQE
ncbi:MAG: protein phosphatase 2C domain-containing protein, partial [Gemmataceae bacterium]